MLKLEINNGLRGDMMVIKTRITEGNESNVRFVNGIVSMGKIKLNVYCFETDGILIDTGAPQLLSEFKSFFKKADVDQVMLTHSHEDHVGGAAFLQKDYKLPIYMNDISVEEASKKASYPFYRKVFWGRREPFHAIPIGETFHSRQANWDVIQTPGHSQDHLSFLNQTTGQLFTGDLFVQPHTKIILRDESIPTIISSIERVLTYDFGEIYCCHAGYVKDGRTMLIKKLHYLKELGEKIFTLQKQGYSEKEIQLQLFKKRYPISYISLGEWDSIHIVRSVLKG